MLKEISNEVRIKRVWKKIKSSLLYIGKEIWVINNILICTICKNSLVKKEKNFECLKYHKFSIEDNIGILVSNPDKHFNV